VVFQDIVIGCPLTDDGDMIERLDSIDEIPASRYEFVFPLRLRM